MTQGVAQQSKTLFLVNKAAAISEALVNAKASIVGAYRFGNSVGGPAVGAAFAAIAATTTAAQIQAIKGTDFDGGGGGTTPSAAGSAPVINGDAQGGTAADLQEVAQPEQLINISFDSAITDTNAVRDFISGPFSEALGDGVNINAVLR